MNIVQFFKTFCQAHIEISDHAQKRKQVNNAYAANRVILGPVAGLRLGQRTLRDQ